MTAGRRTAAPTYKKERVLMRKLDKRWTIRLGSLALTAALLAQRDKL